MAGANGLAYVVEEKSFIVSTAGLQCHFGAFIFSVNIVIKINAINRAAFFTFLSKKNQNFCSVVLSSSSSSVSKCEKRHLFIARFDFFFFEKLWIIWKKKVFTDKKNYCVMASRASTVLNTSFKKWFFLYARRSKCSTRVSNVSGFEVETKWATKERRKVGRRGDGGRQESGTLKIFPTGYQRHKTVLVHHWQGNQIS